MGFKEWIIPQDRVFHDRLNDAAVNAVEAAAALSDLFDNYSDLVQKRERIKEIEHKGDSITHDLFDALGRTFLTPLDREDIAALAKGFDDIVDFIYAASNRLLLYEVAKSTPEMKKFAELLTLQTKELQEALGEIRSPRTIRAAQKHCIEVNRLENLADRLLNDAVAALFKTGDAILIMKFKEVYEMLEIATDKCEDVADVVADIVRKHG